MSVAFKALYFFVSLFVCLFVCFPLPLVVYLCPLSPCDRSTAQARNGNSTASPLQTTPTPLVPSQHRQQDPSTGSQNAMPPQSSNPSSSLHFAAPTHAALPDDDDTTPDSPSSTRLRHFLARATRHLVRYTRVSAPSNVSAMLIFTFLSPSHAHSAWPSSRPHLEDSSNRLLCNHSRSRSSRASHGTRTQSSGGVKWRWCMQ